MQDFNSVFSNPAFDQHEQVVFCNDSGSGLKAIIAIHDTTLGPALGGCRMWDYPSEQDGLRDVLRLARGMTYKSALAGLDLGGGKSVIFGDPRRAKSKALLRAMGRFVESLGGRYIVAEDVGTSVADLKVMAAESRYVVGIQDKVSASGVIRNGDTSPATAYGVFRGLCAAMRHRFDRDNDDLEGVKVAIQGVGNVGYGLAEYLHRAGARLWVSDIYPQASQRARDELGAVVVEPERLFDLDVDIFAPCALGAILNDDTIARLRAKVVAGAANNQLAEDRHGKMLMDRGILYAPDYAINAGGVIDAGCEYEGYEREKVMQRVESIYATLLRIFERAGKEQRATNEIADEMARERLWHRRKASDLAA